MHTCIRNPRGHIYLDTTISEKFLLGKTFTYCDIGCSYAHLVRFPEVLLKSAVQTQLASCYETHAGCM